MQSFRTLGQRLLGENQGPEKIEEKETEKDAGKIGHYKAHTL